MTSIFLTDDHHVVRQGLRSLLEAEADFKVIGESADGVETVKLVEDLQPDVLVVDLMLSGISGIEVTRQVRKRCPNIKIVILSMYGNEAYVIEALRAGTNGYVLKESTANELINAIHTVIVGRHYLSTALSERAIQSYIQGKHEAIYDPYENLTTREREVLQLAAQGFTSNQMAERLYISRRTVEVHRANLMRKLGLSNQTELLRYAIQRGILPSNSKVTESQL